MKQYIYLSTIVLILFASACSSGYKAYKKGDYYKATISSIEKLRNSSGNEKAQFVLSRSYPLAQKTALRNIENASLSTQQNKFDIIVQEYEKLNHMADEIYRTPRALEIFPNPQSFPRELSDAKEQAAEQAYQAGLKALNVGTLPQARVALNLFTRANQYVNGYKNVLSLIEDARYEATLRVVFEKPITNNRFQYSADFFSQNLFSEISNALKSRMVRFYTYNERSNIFPHQYLVLNFEDYSIANVVEKRNTIDVKRDSVKVGTVRIDGVNRDVFNTVTAKYTEVQREIKSGGILSVRIFDTATNALIESRNFAGEYVWVNTYATYRGDERALSSAQLANCQREAVQPPPHQQMFVEFTKPIYTQAVSFIRSYYNRQ